jgi:hypothetical protein
MKNFIGTLARKSHREGAGIGFGNLLNRLLRKVLKSLFTNVPHVGHKE